MSDATIYVVIAERGWVFAGRLTREGDYAVLADCHNVRRWDANRGIGALALEGKDEKTELKFCGRVRIHVLAVVADVECDQAIWNEILGAPRASTKKSRKS